MTVKVTLNPLNPSDIRQQMVNEHGKASEIQLAKYEQILIEERGKENSLMINWIKRRNGAKGVLCKGLVVSHGA